jgi:hypothetical protein
VSKAQTPNFATGGASILIHGGTGEVRERGVMTAGFRWLNVSEAAEEFGVHPDTVRRAIKRHRLNGVPKSQAEYYNASADCYRFTELEAIFRPPMPATAVPAAEAARKLGVARKTITKLVAEHRFKTWKHSGDRRLYVDLEQLRSIQQVNRGAGRRPRSGLVSMRDAAQEFGCTERSIWRFTEEGKLGTYRIRGERQTFVDRKALAKYLASRRDIAVAAHGKVKRSIRLPVIDDLT